ncbi:MAG TPA: hypothetical protein PLE60_12810 [Candidatus Latescibacteria bacterium]|nr:hypothetical protein [Candidatus Latescibacterota bacterium]
MKNIWAVNKATGVMDANITGSNFMWDYLGLSEETHERYYTDADWRSHESGEPLYVSDGKGGHRERTESEIKSGAKYKAWFNAKIESQLEKIDIKRIRPSAEINDDDTGAQDKTAAKAALKTLNAQAAALRAQIIK